METPTTKEDLILVANNSFQKLNIIINSIPSDVLDMPFNFSTDEEKKDAHWDREKNIKDIIVHIHEWHKLVLNWVLCGESGEEKPFLPEPFNWKTYDDMNFSFLEKHKNTGLDEAIGLFKESHKEIMYLMTRFTDNELFLKSACKWAGVVKLANYFIHVTVKHYEWAGDKIKAHIDINH